jgi:hypothetical protein
MTARQHHLVVQNVDNYRVLYRHRRRSPQLLHCLQHLEHPVASETGQYPLTLPPTHLVALGG